MSDSPDKRAWLSRVLDVSFEPTSGGGDLPIAALAQLKEAIDYVGGALPTLTDAPDLAQFTARLQTAKEAFQSRDAARGLPLAEALRDEVAAALSQARGTAATTVAKGSVGRAKLALGVRDAHAAAAANLESMGRRLLALPEVQQDEQLPEVKATLKRLEKLIPPLDDALAQALERYDGAATDGERAQAGRDAMAQMQGIQRKLAGNNTLRQIERFAAAELGGLKITQDLRATLADTAAELKQAAS